MKLRTRFARAGRRARRVPGTMNGSERRYAETVLTPRQAKGEIDGWFFEAVTLKLAPDTRYTPDFMVVLDNGEVEFHEVKGGFMEDHSHVKIKVAAEKFPFRFWLAKERRKKDGGGFEIKEVGEPVPPAEKGEK